MPRAIWNGAVLAESDHTEIVEGNHYFPVDALDRDYFRPSATHSECSWKGTASYYDVVVNGGTDRDAVRSLANFILASNKDRLRPSDITAGVRTLRGQPEYKIREGAGRFCALGWLHPEEDKPGAPPKAWRIVPGLREHFAERRKQAETARAEAHAILKAGGSHATP